MIQGTGFFLKGIEFVTCAHCGGDRPYVYSASDPKKYDATILRKNDDLDLALLNIPDLDHEKFLKRADTAVKEEYGDRIKLLGYPKFAPGKRINVANGEITAFRRKSGVSRFNISSSIVEGNSGDPVLNNQGYVIGVAVTGADFEHNAHRTDDHGVISIDTLSELARS